MFSKGKKKKKKSAEERKNWMAYLKGKRWGPLTWNLLMSLGFPAVFKQFWLHLRKNFKKNLWRESNVLHFYVNIFSERIYLHYIRSDSKVIVFQVWGISAALPVKQHGWPSATWTCKCGCFQSQVLRRLLHDCWGLWTGSQAGLVCTPTPKLLEHSLSPKKAFKSSSDSCRAKMSYSRGLKMARLAQNPSAPHICGFPLATHTLMLTHLTCTPSHTKQTWDFQPMYIKSENGTLPSKDRVFLWRRTLGLLWLITSVNVLSDLL